jgi:predicted nucleotidyltransferase
VSIIAIINFLYESWICRADLGVKRIGIWQWLSETQSNLYIGELHLFGSTVGRKSNATDVDLLIITRRKNVRRNLERLKAEFKLNFNKRLDVQPFHRTQVHHIIEFKRKCGPRKVIGDGKRSLLRNSTIFEKRISEHSAVTSWVRLPCEEEFIYRISRIRYGDQVLVWLADQYLFTDMDFYNRPQQLRPEDYILIAKPEASGRVSAELIRQYRIGVGKLGMFMGALK